VESVAAAGVEVLSGIVLFYLPSSVERLVHLQIKFAVLTSNNQF
jgi:hypothetical protein